MSKYPKDLEPGVVYGQYSVWVLNRFHRFHLQEEFSVCSRLSTFTHLASSEAASLLPHSPLQTFLPQPTKSSWQYVNWNCVHSCLKPSDGFPLLTAVAFQVLHSLPHPRPTSLTDLSWGHSPARQPPAGCWKIQLSHPAPLELVPCAWMVSPRSSYLAPSTNSGLSSNVSSL